MNGPDASGGSSFTGGGEALHPVPRTQSASDVDPRTIGGLRIDRRKSGLRVLRSRYARALWSSRSAAAAGAATGTALVRRSWRMDSIEKDPSSESDFCLLPCAAEGSAFPPRSARLVATREEEGEATECGYPSLRFRLGDRADNAGR